MLTRAVDAALEISIVGSFSRLGYRARRELERWPEDPQDRPLSGRRVLVTGATSGIGLAAAIRFARLGADVQFVARDEQRASVARRRIAEAADSDDVGFELADMGDFDAVRRLATRLIDAKRPLDVVLHNAGALHRAYGTAPDGTEATLATHVIGPFLLTGLLLPVLRAARPARVITMSSGGMYTQRFVLAELEMAPANYDGRVAYARAKRAQVVLNREWARRVPPDDVVFHAMHPGWVNTPGIETGLPGFHRVMGPLLRTPDEGADTAVWLATAAGALATSGRFWHDRRLRSEHHLPWTRTHADGSALWDLCVHRAEFDPMDRLDEPVP